MALAMLLLPSSVSSAAQGLLPVLPLPTWWAAGNQSATLTASTFAFAAAAGSEDADGVLVGALERYYPLTFAHTHHSAATDRSGQHVGLRVTVADPSAPLELGANESYVLTIRPSGAAAIDAPTVWGALRALETFAQLVSYDFIARRHRTPPVLPLRIVDRPRFPHRGLMLDVGRHFLPVARLRRAVDSLSYAKLNVLHLHLTEAESFPMPSRVFPELPARGAFSPGEQYSWEDIQAVIEYGRRRGVRVLPEFEMPGHSASWSRAHPEIFATMEATPHPPCCTKPGTPVWPSNFPSAGTPGYPKGCPLSEANTTLGACPFPNTAMDPSSPATFPFLERQLTDWLGPDGLFADAHVHLGGDEVPTTAWWNTRTLGWANRSGIGGPGDASWVNFSKAHGRTIASPVCYEFSCRPTADLFSAISSHFINRVYEIVRRLGKKPTYWIEAWLGTNLPKGAVVQNWYTGDFTYKIAASGHRVIHSPEGNYSDGWYLDGLNQGWESMYLVDPGRNISEELLPLILGGEGCMWERLWSPGSVNSTDAAKWRMENFRCLLLERGIASDVVGEVGREGLQGPGSCTQGEPYILDQAPCVASGRCQDDRGRWWDLEPLAGIHQVGEPATGVTYTFALWQNIDPVPVICDRTHSKPGWDPNFQLGTNAVRVQWVNGTNHSAGVPSAQFPGAICQQLGPDMNTLPAYTPTYSLQSPREQQLLVFQYHYGSHSLEVRLECRAGSGKGVPGPATVSGSNYTIEWKTEYACG